MTAVKLLSSEHAVTTLCRVLRVNRSTYYKFLNHKPSQRELMNRRIRNCIVELYARSKKRFGAYKMKKCLEREYRINIGISRICSLMKNMDLPKMSTVKPFYPKHKTASDEVCPNILKQRFDPPEPNKVWVCDFTYLRAAGRFYYLCVILDLFSRKVIAYKLSSKLDTRLAIETLDMAVANRKSSKGVIFHSDRGCQFTSEAFRKHLDELNIVQSFSAKGHPYDNAVMECFFKYLKKEETNRRTYSSFDELNLSIFQYVHGFYNSFRPHSHNNGLSPDQAEVNFL